MPWSLQQAAVIVMLVLSPGDALACGGGGGARGGGGACSFQRCYQHCIDTTGTARSDMMRCSKRCAKQGCS